MSRGCARIRPPVSREAHFPSHPPREEAAIEHSHSVLVVEDDPSIRRLLDALLVSAGYKVRAAIDGLEALDRYAEIRPDLIFLDVTLPRLSGWEVLERLQKHHDPPPVVLLTADQRAVRRARAAGAAMAILKPFDIDVVLELTERLVAHPSA